MVTPRKLKAPKELREKFMGNWDTKPSPDWVSVPEPKLMDQRFKMAEKPSSLSPKNLSLDLKVVDVLRFGPHAADALICGAAKVPARVNGKLRRVPSTVQYLEQLVTGDYVRPCKPDSLVMRANLDYPLSTAVGVEIQPYDLAWRSPFYCMTVGWLVWSLARAYEKIYEKPDHYGVWGHGLEDLFFENLTINGNEVRVLGMGS